MKLNLVKQFEIPKKQYFAMLPHFQEEKRQAFITLVLTLASVSIFGIFAINPTLSTIAQLHKEIEDSEFINQKLQEKVTNLSRLGQQYTLLAADLPIIYNAIPQSPDAAILTGKLQAIAAENSVAIKKMQIFETELATMEKKPDKYAAFSFSLEAEGSYDALLRFVSALVAFDRVIGTDTIALSLRSERTGAYVVTIRGQAFYKKDI